MQGEEHYSGSSSHKLVDGLISGPGSELLVVSPYIDNYYARALLKASKRKKVRIITSPDALEYRNSFLKSLGAQKMKGYAKATLYFSVLSAVTVCFGLYYMIAPVIAITALMFLLMLRARNSTAIQLKVIKKPFVHEKLYVCNGVAVTGSANLTYSGMHRNVEHVDLTRKEELVSALKDHFEELWAREPTE